MHVPFYPFRRIFYFFHFLADMDPANDEQQLALRKLAHLQIICRFKDNLALGPYSTNNDRQVDRERREQIWTTIKAEVEAAGQGAYWAPGSLASLELFKYRNWSNWKMSAKVRYCHHFAYHFAHYSISLLQRKYERIRDHGQSRCVLNACDRFIINNIWGKPFQMCH